MLNAVHELARWTLDAGVVETYTDSNTRERRPYECDGLIASTGRNLIQNDAMWARTPACLTPPCSLVMDPCSPPPHPHPPHPRPCCAILVVEVGAHCALPMFPTRVRPFVFSLPPLFLSPTSRLPYQRPDAAPRCRSVGVSVVYVSTNVM